MGGYGACKCVADRASEVSLTGGSIAEQAKRALTGTCS